MTEKYLTITPHDPLIARDGRPFGRGINMKSLDWPYPSVLTGSLRTMLGKLKGGKFDKDTVAALRKVVVAGPLPVYNNRLYFPAPGDILVDNKHHNYPLRPAKMKDGEGCNLPSPLYPAMLPDNTANSFKSVETAQLWSFQIMTDWLVNAKGDSFDTPPTPEKTSENPEYLKLPEKDRRIHILNDPGDDRDQDESRLFETIGLDYNLKNESDGIRIAAKTNIGEFEFKNSFHTMGGERRLAHWAESEKHGGWKCPDKVITALGNTRRIRMVLATPAIFSGGYLPGWLDENTLKGHPPGAPDNITLRLVSACISRWKPLSGWSLEKGKTGPKPVQRVVPAGSVYFFEADTKGNLPEMADALWLKQVSDDPQNRCDGFGLALWGIWDYLKKEDEC